MRHPREPPHASLGKGCCRHERHTRTRRWLTGAGFERTKLLERHRDVRMPCSRTQTVPQGQWARLRGSRHAGTPDRHTLWCGPGGNVSDGLIEWAWTLVRNVPTYLNLTVNYYTLGDRRPTDRVRCMHLGAGRLHRAAPCTEGAGPCSASSCTGTSVQVPQAASAPRCKRGVWHLGSASCEVRPVRHPWVPRAISGPSCWSHAGKVRVHRSDHDCSCNRRVLPPD